MIEVMSARTTGKPGYTGHMEAAELPRYDRAFFKHKHEEKDEDHSLATLTRDWASWVQEDTNEC